MSPIALFRRVRDLWSSGSAAVEFALTAPLLVMLGMGVADYGDLAATAAALAGASRAGAEVVFSNPATTPTQLNSYSPSLIPTVFSTTGTLSFSVSPTCTCIDGTVLATCPPAVNTTPCAGTLNPYTSPATVDQRVLQYASITATQSSFAPLVGFTSFLFPGSVTATTSVRTQQ
jgi:Flp pilus assembly protein TadG